MPQRIQLRRTKGWRKPEGAIVVARPTKWGNPFRVGQPYAAIFAEGPEHGEVADREHAVSLFRRWLAVPESVGTLRDEIRDELAGRGLACWCPLSEPCHADVLLEIANSPVLSPAYTGDPR